MPKVDLSEHFTAKRIFYATIGPIMMVVFSSIYSIIDGLFLSRYGGEGAFSGINLIFPLIMIFGSLGFLFGTGGSATVGKVLGEKDPEKASKIFSMVIYASIVTGVIVSILSFFLVEPVVNAMAKVTANASEAMKEKAVLYGRILSGGLLLYVLQNVFQSFFSTAEKPLTGFFFTFAAGVTNIVFDAIFIVGLGYGVMGAAAATLMGEAVGGVLPLFYFRFKKDLPFHLGRASFSWKALLKIMGNGSSEFVSNTASSIVGICYNAQLLAYVGEDGISAYAVSMYAGYVFMAIFMGYSVGLAPAIAYNYGAQNKKELKNLLDRSLINLAVMGVAMFVLCEALAVPLASMFAGDNEQLRALSLTSIRIYAFVFLIVGISIFGSAFFTALSNGAVSAVISIARTLCFELVFVYTLPLAWGVNGIFSAAVFAELGSALLTAFFLIYKQKKYGY
jgi:putative MATE family efflux protein